MERKDSINKRALFVLLGLLISQFANAAFCPDGSYVSGDTCTLAPDGSYVKGDRATLAPDGSYVGGNGCQLMPDSSYVGGDHDTDESFEDEHE